MKSSYLTWFTWLCLLLVLLYFLYRLNCMRKITRRVPFVCYCTFLFLLYIAHILVFSWSSVGLSTLFLFAAQFALIIAFQFKDPGIVTADNFRTAQWLWKYDGKIYKEKVCAHTGIPAPARSTYCKDVHRRIARFSHFSSVFGNAVGIGNHALFLGLEAVSLVSSVFCGMSSWRALLRAARAAPPMDPPSSPFVDGLYFVVHNHTAGLVVFAVFAVLTLFQSAAFAGDCAWVHSNVMPAEAVDFDLLADGANPYDRGRKGNWEETLFPRFPPRDDRPVKPPGLQKTV
jgi:hypothetical protein